VAIKILEAPPEFFVVRCYVCSTKFGYQVDDIKRTLVSGVDPGHVECPTCHQHIKHDPDRANRIGSMGDGGRLTIKA